MSAARLLPESVTQKITLDEVRRRAAAVLQAHPRLTYEGFHVGRLPVPRRDHIDYEQVRLTILFVLIFCKRRKTFNSKARSYRLKHCAENWVGEPGPPLHVSNGEFILAALICGYKHRRDGFDSHNCIFNMSLGREVHRYDDHVYGRIPSVFARMRF